MRRQRKKVNSRKHAKLHHSALTQQTVTRLNALEEQEAGNTFKSWIAKGKAVADYVEAASKGEKHHRDFHAILASHPRSNHKASQLRNFQACYELFQDFKPGAMTHVSMTHLVQVLPRRINRWDKQELLKLVQSRRWSVKQLKDEIQQRYQKDTAFSNRFCWRSEMDSLRGRAQLALEQLSRIRLHQQKSKSPRPIPPAVREDLEQLASMISKHFLDASKGGVR